MAELKLNCACSGRPAMMPSASQELFELRLLVLYAIGLVIVGTHAAATCVITALNKPRPVEAQLLRLIDVLKAQNKQLHFDAPAGSTSLFPQAAKPIPAMLEHASSTAVAAPGSPSLRVAAQNASRGSVAVPSSATIKDLRLFGSDWRDYLVGPSVSNPADESAAALQQPSISEKPRQDGAPQIADSDSASTSSVDADPLSTDEHNSSGGETDTITVSPQTASRRRRSAFRQPDLGLNQHVQQQQPMQQQQPTTQQQQQQQLASSSQTGARRATNSTRTGRSSTTLTAPEAGKVANNTDDNIRALLATIPVSQVHSADPSRPFRSLEFAEQVKLDAMCAGNYTRATEDISHDREWKLVHTEGVMNVYRKEIVDGERILDLLKAYHTVEGVAAGEVARNFWSFDSRLEWEATVDSAHALAIPDDTTIVIHSVFKRVWPATQRETVIVDHIRPISAALASESPAHAGPGWMVVCVSTDHPKAPIVPNGLVRATCNITMTCRTRIKPGTPMTGPIPRSCIATDIVYMANVDPGGYVPSSLTRAVSKREYPKFLHAFERYCQTKIQNAPTVDARLL
ncbi:collagen type IV alpha-3-binding protein [Capsaspora owczarzaki ATCC 30864]|uniref:Collagen type IV alpha-3-binding protein n=1 Tax=Capsaspora owczarzaki (strain ATCC 30864) TaxID=595528 RepID=A0A0D2VH04_CAPO3|nr:collagen type IV alpha-3-binding protein [Capsaspora owczarzaki ATCC 30864]